MKARESQLDALRADVAEKKRALKQLAAERQRQLQNREEQRLLRQLQRIEEKAEKLRQPLDLSDAETCKGLSDHVVPVSSSCVCAFCARPHISDAEVSAALPTRSLHPLLSPPRLPPSQTIMSRALTCRPSFIGLTQMFSVSVLSVSLV